MRDTSSDLCLIYAVNRQQERSSNGENELTNITAKNSEHSKRPKCRNNMVAMAANTPYKIRASQNRGAVTGSFKRNTPENNQRPVQSSREILVTVSTEAARGNNAAMIVQTSKYGNKMSGDAECRMNRYTAHASRINTPIEPIGPGKSPLSRETQP